MLILDLTRRRFVQVLSGTGLGSVFRGLFPSFGVIRGEVSNRKLGAGESFPGLETSTPQVAGSPAKSDIRIFRVPGAEYRNMIQGFASEFLNHYRAKQPLPISRIFEIFPIQIADHGTAKDLIDRGALNFTSESVANEGEKLEVKFTDQNVGRLAVVFNKDAKAKIADISGRTFQIEFDESHQVPVVFFNLDPKQEMAANQRLEKISFGKDIVSYTLREKTDPTRKVRIDVDTTFVGPKQPINNPNKRKGTPKTTASIVGLTTVAFHGQTSTVPPDDCQDTRPFVGPIRCDCCGGHPATANCPPGKGGSSQPLQPHPVTFVNRTGQTLYVYFAIFQGGTFDCLNLGYDGTLDDGASKSYTIPADKVGWFKFQEDSKDKCTIRNNKAEYYPRGGSSVVETIFIV